MKWTFALRCLLAPVVFVCSSVAVLFVYGAIVSASGYYNMTVNGADRIVREAMMLALASFFPIIACGATAPSHKEMMAALAALIWCAPLLAACCMGDCRNIELAVAYTAAVALAWFIAVEVLHGWEVVRAEELRGRRDESRPPHDSRPDLRQAGRE